MERKFFKLKLNIQDLDKYGPPSVASCSLNYLTELMINDNEISLKIFHPDKEYLGDKLMEWNSNTDVDILKCFEIIETLESKEFVSVDFTGFRCNGISIGSDFYEQFNLNEPSLKYFIIKLTGIRIGFNNLVDRASEFYLNQTGFSLVEMNYRYPVNFPWQKEPFKIEPKNQVEEYIKFDKIEFKPEHHFYNTTKMEDSFISIQKEPRFLVKHGNLNEEEIRKQVTMLCGLFSFYAHNDVDYYVAKTNAKNGRFYERTIKKNIESDGHGIFMWDFGRNPLNLIVNVDTTHLMANYEFVINTIKRFNYAMNLSGESRFMILYNILEQIRVQYILEKKIELEKAGDPPKLNKVTQEYEFKESRTQVDKNIRAALEKVSEIIIDDQKEDFKTEISHKVKNIKLMSMANQFISLFNYTNINPSICNLDFDEIRLMRNKIFHGNPIEDLEIEYLEKISRYDRFPRFVGIMLLKYFGIDNLNEIEKKYSSN